MLIFVEEGLIKPGFIAACTDPLHHPDILKRSVSERFELYKQGFKHLHGKDCTTTRSLTYITFYDNYNKKKRAVAGATVTGRKRTTATATAEGGGPDEMETTTVAAAATFAPTTAAVEDVVIGAEAAAVAVIHAGTKKKNSRLVNIDSIISTHAASALWSVEVIAKFRDVATQMKWKADLVKKLLNQKICCCGKDTCQLSPLAPGALPGYHFCTKTGLRLSASWCQEGYEDFNGDQAWTSTTHPCIRCASL